MYTEKSVELKSDFYSRYGSTGGTLYFERVGLPCVIMRGTTRTLAFAAECGVRAYGRKCGDVLRVIDSDSNVCDVHFKGSGNGAQIIYKMDIPGMKNSDRTAEYTVNKLMSRMGIKSDNFRGGDAWLCDMYGSGGWCAVMEHGMAQSVPLPLSDYNVMIVRVRKNGGRRADPKSADCFLDGEDRRIEAAVEGLKSCKTNVLIDMINESERAAELLLPLGSQARAAVEAARCADGVEAARICGMGVMCILKKEMTDIAAHIIREDFEKRAGCCVGIAVIK